MSALGLLLYYRVFSQESREVLSNAPDVASKPIKRPSKQRVDEGRQTGA